MRFILPPLILFFSIGFSQTPGNFYHIFKAPLNGNGEAGEKVSLPSPATWVEKEELRSPFSSTYLLPDGQMLIEHSAQAINFYDGNGRLVPIKPGLAPSQDGWAALQQPFPTGLTSNGSTWLSIAPGKQLRFNQNCFFNGIGFQEPLLQISETYFRTPGTNGVYKEYEFLENGVKYNYVLSACPQISGDYLVISEEINLPKGYILEPDLNNGEKKSGSWAGDLVVKNQSGVIVSRFHLPICFDQQKNLYAGSYRSFEKNGKTVLEIRIDKSWLTDVARTYPVVIDPLVVGPTTQWSGGSMPSCIVPTYNRDSIQVTIPGGISVTNLMITSSYYAVPLSGATMAMGSMQFSTVCGTSQTFTVQPPQGNQAGTAYLDSFNIQSPLMCCFQSDCNARTFYLRMHLGRTGPATGCNITYIRYEPSTQWKFKALIMGRTPEAYGLQWTVPTTPICGRDCNFTATAFVRYGVPPYTITHPWMVGPLTVGTVNTCGTGAVAANLNLTIPNCPVFCDTVSSISVPPPVVIDACGVAVTGFPPRTLPRKISPNISMSPDTTVVCSGDPFGINLISCASGATLNWTGNNTSGIGNISDAILNTGTSPNQITYTAFASINGCNSDTTQSVVVVNPFPAAGFNYSPQTIIAGTPVNFSNASSTYAGNPVYVWTFGDNAGSTLVSPSHTYADPGTYTVCLRASTDPGCPDSVCMEITVIAPEIIAPNVFTPNGDGLNDFLAFQFLEYFPDNELEIFNRWGNQIMKKKGYANDWNGDNLSAGTYYYILSVPTLKKTYKGFIEILR
jgi:gliding motility-associated-like protein